ncbi:MAG: formyl-CoA transferase [Rhodospirillaceae bacterium]|nr:formyl-CoA transferase [Rhodospirillaceae bacterium]
MTGGPLEGVRVIDQTTVVVGPICGRTLADYGADVIKVEAPKGDLLRTMAEGSRNPGMSGKFMNFNRNKRSVCLDIKKSSGLDVLKKLISTADVFVSNVRPQGLARAGLSYEDLFEDNPQLIYCSIVGFGKGGRYYNRPAYDPIIQSVSGVAATLHRATGEPRFVPMVMTDHTTGLIAAQAIGFALFRREKTGVGQAIEVPMFENMASFVTSEHMGGHTFEPPVGPTGDGRLLSPYYRPLATRDGFITVGPNTNEQAFAFFDAIDQPELKIDPRFNSAANRTANAEDYFKVRKEALLNKTTDQWLSIFEAKDVPAQRYNTLEDILTDPHLVEVDFFSAENHPSEGTIKRTRPANTYSGGGRSDRMHAPLLGENTYEILKEMGYSSAEIESMTEEEAVIQATKVKK